MSDHLLRQLYGHDILVSPIEVDMTVSIAAASFALATRPAPARRIGDNAPDSLLGTSEVDRLDGKGGNDTLIGLDGADVIIGGGGNDRLIGGAGDDRLKAGGGDDVVKGGGGDDRLIGGAGNDKLSAGGGDDFLKGGGGNDKLKGGGGADRLKGGGGDDTLKGGGGDDRLIGGAGDDSLNGGGAGDILEGGAGSDLLRGGAGSDVYIFRSGEFRTGAIDRILDFKPGEDKIDLTGVEGAGTFDSIDFGRWGDLVTIEIGTGRIILSGITSTDQLSEDDFLLSGIIDDRPDDNDRPGDGHDTMAGTDDTPPGGDDTMAGGDDTMAGGDDTMAGGDDTMPGGDDTMAGGDDTMPGGDDTMAGGDDTMPGGGDTMAGGDDTMPGGDDTMAGGDDTMAGGDDTMAGGDDTMPGGGDTMAGGDDTMPGGDDTMAGGDDTMAGGDDTMPGGDDTMTGGDDDTIPGGDDTVPPLDGVVGTENNDLLTGELAGGEFVRGLGGNDTIASGSGSDTLVGGEGIDLFVVRLEDGDLGAEIDIIQDFSYFSGDQIDLTEALSGVSFAQLQEVVRATPTAGNTLIAVDRGNGFEDVLRLDGVTFTTEALIPYGFKAPAPGSAVFLENPFGFTNDSNNSVDPDATRDGSYIAFVEKDDLDFNPGDFNLLDVFDEFDQELASLDVFVRNMLTGEIQRVNVGADGVIATTSGGFESKSMSPAISENGRFVAYATDGQAAAADVNAEGDIYVRDLLADTDPVLVSVAADGSAGGGVPLGRDDFSTSVSVVDISADGQRIAFVSTADLTDDSATDTNGTADIYLRDLVEGTTELVSVGTSANTAGGGVAAPYDNTFQGLNSDVVEISANGRFVAYLSASDHAAGDTDGGQDVYLRDTATGQTVNVTGLDSAKITGFSISADGSRIAFATVGALDGSDTNGKQDIYIADIDLSTLTVADAFRVSLAEGGFEVFGGDAVAPKISADGERVAFQSDAFDIIPIDRGQQNFDGPQFRLFDVEIATGEISTTQDFYELDKAQQNAGNTAYTFTDDQFVYRKAVEVDFPSSDSLVVEETVRVEVGDLAPDDNTSDEFSGVQLSTSERFYRSEVNGIEANPEVDEGLSDKDVFSLRTFQTVEYVVRVKGEDSVSGTLPDPEITIFSFSFDETTGGTLKELVVRNDAIVFPGTPENPENLDTEVSFIAEAGHSYSLEVNSFETDGLGTYLIDFTETDNLF